MDRTVIARRALVLLLAAGASALAVAQNLEDPTRPPAILAPADPHAAAAPAADSAPRLQSVLIGRGPGARHVAVIDGVTVRQGEKFRGARLERVSETEVELVKGAQRQILKLFPAEAHDASPQH